jgi:hypothetical protein
MQLLDRNGRPIVSASQQKQKGRHILAATLVCNALFAIAACAGLVSSLGALILVVAFAGTVGFASPRAVNSQVPPAYLWLLVICWAWILALPFGITSRLGFVGLVGIPLSLCATHLCLAHRLKTNNTLQ